MIIDESLKLGRKALKVSSKVLGKAYKHGWQSPANARGHLWTLSMWLSVAGVLVLLVAAINAAIPALLLFGAGWVLRKVAALKPKKHVRELPYRRHRQ